jgi:hypothetical protein
VTTLTSLARAEAVRAGIAQPITTVRHTHLHARPLVLVPLTLAGEANAPLAAMVGTDRHAPVLLVVAQPRSRDLRFAFAAELGEAVIAYAESFTTEVEAVPANRGTEIRVRYANGPQIVVPNRGGIGFVKLFGRSTRFRRTDGPYAVAPTVPELGRWLTYFAERTEQPGADTLIAATDVLAAHWATGQSAVEDQNLAALLGWIDPPAGSTGARAAALAEDPRICPPAGPVTDPAFDNDVLAPLIRAEDRPGLTDALAGQLRPTWDLVWRALDLAGARPEGVRVATRWGAELDAFTAHVAFMRDIGLPQPRRDHAVAAAARLHRLERAQTAYAAQRALDDPLVFAEYRLSGEAFAGTVTAADPERVIGDGRGRKLRPLITVATDDPVRLSPGTDMTEVNRPGQTGTVVETGDGVVVLELSGGMGRGQTPSPGSVPEVGDPVRYTSLDDGFQPAAKFPVREDTPWTHGGPPPEYVPTDADAAEEWA